MRAELERISTACARGERGQTLESTLESLVGGALVVDSSGALITANRAADRILRADLRHADPNEWDRGYRFLDSDGRTPLHVSELPLARALRGERVEPVELYLFPPASEQGTWLSFASQPLEEGGALGVFREIGAPGRAPERGRVADGAPARRRRTLEQRLALLIDASGTLFGSLETSTVLPSVLDLARDMIDADAYAIWRAGEEGEWRVICANGLSEDYQRASLGHEAAVWALENRHAIEDVLSVPALAARRAQYEAEGIRSALAAPLRLHGKTRGSLAFYSRRRRRFQELEVRTAEALANLAAAAIESAELYEQQTRMRARAEEAERRSAFLAKATAILGSSLEYRTTLAQVARLAVPAVADWCTVEMIESDGSLEQLALAHTDPARVEWARELRRRYPPAADTEHGLRSVIRTGRSEIVAEITDEMVERSAQDPAHLRHLREARLRSYMCVPIVARERVLGAISFLSAESGKRYGPEDLAVAEHLARRAALAIDNALLYDATQRERAAAEAALKASRRSEERFRKLGEAGIIGIFQGEGDRISEANDLFLEMIGYTRADLAAGLYWPEITAPEFADADERALDELLRRGACAPYEKEYIRKNGSRIPVLLGRVMIASPPAFTWVSFAVDLTERRHLEARLREAQKLESIGLLAGGVAHDFNNILTGVLGNASLVLEDLPPGAPVRPLVETIANAAERAADLTRQLLAYSGRGRFVVQPVDLTTLLEELTPLLRASISRKVTVRFDLEYNLPLVEADASQMRQLILDLVMNAAEAIGDEIGTVVVRTGMEEVTAEYRGGLLTEDGFARGRYVRLEVEDTGCGMDEDTMARIFDPFFTTKFTGRGLGLAAALGIVRGHRGDISVWSQPGQGSRFRVLLPEAEPSAATLAEPYAARELAGAGTILLVDDEEVVVETTRAVLEHYGYRVLVARDGREAVETLDRHASEIDLVLLDMIMPVMSGDEALAHLRKIRPGIPVIVSSGYSEIEAARRFDHRGTVAFIQKPYTGARLARIVKQALTGKARALGAPE